MAEIIQGMAQFESRLRELELIPRRGALMKAARAGARIVLKFAKVRSLK